MTVSCEHCDEPGKPRTCENGDILYLCDWCAAAIEVVAETEIRRESL